MEPLILRRLPYNLTAQAGLALVGQLLSRCAQVDQVFDPAFPVRGGVRTSDLIRSYVGCSPKASRISMPSRPIAQMPRSADCWAFVPCLPRPPCASDSTNWVLEMLRSALTTPIFACSSVARQQ